MGNKAWAHFSLVQLLDFETPDEFKLFKMSLDLPIYQPGDLSLVSLRLGL